MDHRDEGFFTPVRLQQQQQTGQQVPLRQAPMSIQGDDFCDRIPMSSAFQLFETATGAERPIVALS